MISSLDKIFFLKHITILCKKHFNSLIIYNVYSLAKKHNYLNLLFNLINIITIIIGKKVIRYRGVAVLTVDIANK